MILRVFLILALISLTAVPQYALSKQSEMLVAFRDSSGSYTKESTKALRAMGKAATKSGQIEIWVTFDMKFVGNPVLRTPEIVANETAEKHRLISLTIGQIAQIGEGVLLPTPSGLEEAPGCMVAVTVRGLDLLAAHSEVKHLSYTAQ